MCGRFTSLTIDDVRDALVAVQARIDARADRWAIAPSRETSNVRPSSLAAVMAQADRTLQAEELAWGFQAEWSNGGLVFNTRIEKAAGADGMWPPIAEQGRCLVPAAAFWEADRATRKPELFLPAEDDLLVMAGVCADGRFSVVTTEPDAVVAQVHDRMPLCLTPRGASLWLSLDWREVTAQPTAPLVRQSQQMSLFEL